MNGIVNELVAHLNGKFGNYFSVEETPKYFKIVRTDGQRSVYAFIVKSDNTTKAIGTVKKGDILKPASWSVPAKHARGNLYNRESWSCCNQYSVTYLK